MKKRAGFRPVFFTTIVARADLLGEHHGYGSQPNTPRGKFMTSFRITCAEKWRGGLATGLIVAAVLVIGLCSFFFGTASLPP